ncbi:MAG: hypothetical protein SNI42_06765 [Rikenellaceae bacterium]
MKNFTKSAVSALARSATTKSGAAAHERLMESEELLNTIRRV